jgi:hypothetical protein
MVPKGPFCQWWLLYLPRLRSIEWVEKIIMNNEEFRIIKETLLHNFKIFSAFAWEI